MKEITRKIKTMVLIGTHRSVHNIKFSSYDYIRTWTNRFKMMERPMTSDQKTMTSNCSSTLGQLKTAKQDAIVFPGLSPTSTTSQMWFIFISFVECQAAVDRNTFWDAVVVCSRHVGICINFCYYIVKWGWKRNQGQNTQRRRCFSEYENYLT